MKKIYAFVILSWVLLFCFCGCREVDSLEQGLMFAGDNRAELEKVLKHYRQTLEDSLKYKAACFLISNMRWHENYEDTVSFNCDLQPFSTDRSISCVKVDWVECADRKIREVSRNKGFDSECFEPWQK